MKKTSNISVRVNPEIKQNAEVILDNLGISMSSAISMFLSQVKIQNGLPFEVKNQQMISVDSITDEELIKLLNEANESANLGKTIKFTDEMANLRKKINKL